MNRADVWYIVEAIRNLAGSGALGKYWLARHVEFLKRSKVQRSSEKGCSQCLYIGGTWAFGERSGVISRALRWNGIINFSWINGLR